MSMEIEQKKEDLHLCEHVHSFGMDKPMEGERRTLWVVILTLVTMVAEIISGTVFGSMALLADGWHMGTHAAALGVALFAYGYARKNANNPDFSFGTGKVSALGGFASAVGLAIVALFIMIESASRLHEPVAIHFNEAIFVAVVGLIVNLVSAWILWGGRGHHHHGEHLHNHHHDHNLRGAFLHVMADALTSVMAILALVLGKEFGWYWMDPMIGVVGALIIARWSVTLLRDSGRVLLDAEVSSELHRKVRTVIEQEGDTKVVDLHLWRVGPAHLAAVISVVCNDDREPLFFKELLTDFNDLAHVTVEVNSSK